MKTNYYFQLRATEIHSKNKEHLLHQDQLRMSQQRGSSSSDRGKTPKGAWSSRAKLGNNTHDRHSDNKPTNVPSAFWRDGTNINVLTLSSRQEKIILLVMNGSRTSIITLRLNNSLHYLLTHGVVAWFETSFLPAASFDKCTSCDKLHLFNLKHYSDQ